MPFYEHVFIARQDLTSSQAEALAQKFTDILKDEGGQVTKTEYWGLKHLAYKIKKNRKGHYHLLNIEATPAAITELERTMSLNEDIIRFLTVRVNKLDNAPSVQMRYKSDRDESFNREDDFEDSSFPQPRDGYRPRTRTRSETKEETLEADASFITAPIEDDSSF